MDSKGILQKIIDEEGSCDWINDLNPSNPHYICERCPMSKLRKHKDGRYLSCFEALGLDDPGIIANSKYKQAAEHILSDISIEDMLVEKE